MTIEDAVLQLRTQTVPTEDTEMVELKISKADYDAFETITKGISNGSCIIRDMTNTRSDVSMYDKVKYLLKKRNAKMLDLEKAMDVSSGYLCRLEDNFESLSFKYVIKMADFFKMSIDELLYGEVEK